MVLNIFRQQYKIFHKSAMASQKLLSIVTVFMINTIILLKVSYRNKITCWAGMFINTNINNYYFLKLFAT